MRRGAKTLLSAVAMVAGLAMAAYSSNGSAQAASVKTAVGDDLRAAYANAVEVAEGKRLAETSCARCHGINGISTTKGIPHLAGQRPAYLLLELRAYQSGLRGDSLMGAAVKFLSDDALFKVAAYYANLEPPRPEAPSKGGAAKDDPVAAGKAATSGCAGCHGDAGISKTPGTPSLIGLDPKYIAAAIKAYKGGQRKNEMMKTLVASVSEAEMGNIALFYALQKPGRARNPNPGDQAAGKTAAAACAGCHGDQGVSGNPATPSLAGQDAQYLASALKEYKDGARSDETMKGLAAPLDDRTIKNLAAYYAGLQPQAPKVRKPLSTGEWAQRCDRCHGINGNSTDPRLPMLAAQRIEYLEKTLHAYRTGARKSPAMAAMSEVLTESDVENLATHYAQQKPRSVVYVMVPAK